MADVQEVITIDQSGSNDMTVFLDIAFPAIPCEDLRMDVLDQMGNVPRASLQKIKYTPFVEKEKNIIYCTPCEGIEDTSCCNCDAVSSLLSSFDQFYSKSITCKPYVDTRKANGCRVTSHLRIPKMKGNIHFAPGSSESTDGAHHHQLNPFTYLQDIQKLKLNFQIFLLSFGPKYPGMEVGLLNHKENHVGLVRQTFFLELVPTIYLESSNFPIFTHQYSVTNHTEAIDIHKPLTQLPGIFFSFDLSPMLISISKEEKSILHLLTRLCAVIGGTWVVFGLMFAATRRLRKE